MLKVLFLKPSLLKIQTHEWENPEGGFFSSSLCVLVLSYSIFVCLFSFPSRAKHRSDPGGSGRGHQRDCEALPQAGEGGERRQSRQAPTCSSIIHHKWKKKSTFLLWWSPSPSVTVGHVGWFTLLKLVKGELLLVCRNGHYSNLDHFFLAFSVLEAALIIITY